MNKRNFSIFLIVFVLLFLAGIFVYFYFFQTKNASTVSQKTNAPVFALTLTSAPNDGSSTAENKVTIEGSTGTEAVVVINGGAEDVSVQTVNGRFSLNYTLSEGENQILISAFDQKTGESKSATREVFYTTEIKSL